MPPAGHRREFADRNVVGVVLNGITPELSPYIAVLLLGLPANAKSSEQELGEGLIRLFNVYYPSARSYCWVARRC